MYDLINNRSFGTADSLLAANNMNAFTELRIARSCRMPSAFEPMTDESLGMKLKRLFQSK